MFDAFLVIFFLTLILYGLMLIFKKDTLLRWEEKLGKKGILLPYPMPKSTTIGGIIIVLGGAAMLFLVITQR